MGTPVTNGLVISTAIIATRSSFKRHRTGCVIEKNGRVIGSGWSHDSPINYTSYRSVHAELHALIRSKHQHLEGAVACIITLTKADNFASGKPCQQCAALLLDAGINHVVHSVSGKNREIEYLDLSTININNLKVYDNSYTKPLL